MNLTYWEGTTSVKADLKAEEQKLVRMSPVSAQAAWEREEVAGESFLSILDVFYTAHFEHGKYLHLLYSGLPRCCV